jgi:transposase
VKAVTEQQMSLNQAAAHFMLAGSGSVAKWLKVYEEHGEAGLRTQDRQKETLQCQLIQKKRR